MELLLQAGIHLIKKVITFVIYGRSVQVFKACTLLYFFSAEFFFSQIFLRGDYFVPQISQIYTDFLHHDFSSSDFTEESEAFWLIGLLTDFRRTLAAGQWLAPYICSCFFVTQISLMTQIFLRGTKNSDEKICVNLCKSVGLFPTSGGICNDRTGRICEICVTKKTDLHR